MLKLFVKLLLATVLFQFNVVAIASPVQCRDYFRHDLDSVLEQAGNLEAKLIQTISNARNTSDIQSETQRLANLQKVIEDVLNSDGSNEKIDQLANLLEQYKQQNSAAATQTNAKLVRPTNVAEAKSARKDYDNIQPYLREKYNKF